MNEDQIWAEWDTAVEGYLAAMSESREATRTLKARRALTYDVLKRSGKGVKDSEEAVYADVDYIEAWRNADESEIREKRAKLKLQEIELRLEIWRTRQANRRAEMNLR